MCRKKKIKCDGKMPKCSHCINYKNECVFTQVEKKRNPPKGYVLPFIIGKLRLDTLLMLVLLCSAKYIEGLENRLGRMESLLRLSGLLSEVDSGKTDLGTLERRLADRSFLSAGQAPRMPAASSSMHPMMPGPSSHQSTPRAESNLSPRSPAGSPDSQKESEAELDNLSDMMCSLVTTNCGETRYIGNFLLASLIIASIC